MPQTGPPLSQPASSAAFFGEAQRVSRGPPSYTALDTSRALRLRRDCCSWSLRPAEHPVVSARSGKVRQGERKVRPGGPGRLGLRRSGAGAEPSAEGLDAPEPRHMRSVLTPCGRQRSSAGWSGSWRHRGRFSRERVPLRWLTRGPEPKKSPRRASAALEKLSRIESKRSEEGPKSKASQSQ